MQNNAISKNALTRLAMSSNIELGKIGPRGEPMCKRTRCKRMKELNTNGLCGGHACPVPSCSDSKSSSDALCENHMQQREQPLPKNWSLVTLSSEVPVYLNLKLFTAQYDHPGAKGENAKPNTTKRKLDKPKKGFPLLFLYVMFVLTL